MTRGRLLAAGIVVWVLILGILLQPPSRPPYPTLSHAEPLEPAVVDLPTLAPFKP